MAVEIARIKRQLPERHEELAIFQKAATYFAKRLKCSMSLSKIIGQSSASKSCAECCVWPAVAGTPGGCSAISQTDASSSVWSVMPLSGWRSVTQNIGMVHRDWQMNCRNTTSKPSSPACVVRAFGQKLHGSSGRPATLGMICRYQRTR